MAGSVVSTINVYPGNSGAFGAAAIAGDLVVVFASSNTNTHVTCTDNGSGGSNTYTELIFKQHTTGGQTCSVTVLSAPVTHTGTLTLTLNNPSDIGFAAVLLRGVDNSVVDSDSVADSTATSLVLSLALGGTTASVFTYLANEEANRFSSATGATTSFGIQTGHVHHGHYVLDVAGGTANYGATVTGDADNVLVAIALQTTGAGGVTCTPTTLATTLTTFAPSVIIGNVCTPTTAALTLSTFAPSVVLGTICTPGTLSLAITTFAPELQWAALCVPDTATLELTTFAPNVSTGIICTPDTLALTLTTFAPTILTPVVCTPTTAALELTTYAPFVGEAYAMYLVVVEGVIVTTSGGILQCRIGDGGSAEVVVLQGSCGFLHQLG